MMSLDALMGQLIIEREIDSLKPLPEGFINDSKLYLQDLKNNGDAETNYREQMMIRDEEKNAHILLEGIIDRRFAKLVNMSIIHASGIHMVDPNLFSGIEKDAFNLLVKAMQDARTKLEN